MWTRGGGRGWPAVMWAVLLALLGGACSQAAVATPRAVTLQISGSTSMTLALEELADEFERQHSSVLVNVGGGGSALGEARVRAGRVTLGASTWMEEAPAAVTSAAPAGVVGAGRQERTPPASLVRVPIGLDGIAVVVHSSNAVAGLTLQQVQDIFSGRILDWGEVGGEAGEILLVSREEGSGTRRAFESRVMGESAVSLTAVVMPTSWDVAGYVAGNPSAVGYVSAAYVAAADMPQAGGLATPSPTLEPLAVRAVPVNGVLPMGAAVSSQEYPLIQPLYLVSLGEPRGWARQFVDYALSPAGQAIVGRYHVRVR